MKRIRLSLDKDNDYVSKDFNACLGFGAMLCGKRIYKWFDFPKGTKTIVFCISSKQHSESYCIQKFTNTTVANTVFGNVILDDPLVRKFLAPVIKKYGSVHVSLEIPE